MSARARRRLVIATAGILAASSTALWLALGSFGGGPLDMAESILAAASMLPWWLVGALIVERANGHRVGWLLVMSAMVGSVTLASLAVLSPAIADNGAANGRPVAIAGALAAATYGPWWMLLLLGALVMFPDGHLPSRRWRTPCGIAIAAILGGTSILVVLPGPTAPGLPPNPIGVPALGAIPPSALVSVISLGIALLALVGLAAVAVRFRGRDQVVRQQLKWLLLVVIPVAVSAPVGFFDADQTTTSPADLVLAIALIVLMPASIGVAILRYRLYEIDRIISRTLGWALVTGILAALFAGLVIGLQSLLAGMTQGQTLAVAGSTLAAAALFQPVRRSVQHLVDRRFDRARYDGERLAAAFGEQLRDRVALEDVAGALARTAQTAVRPSGASVWLRNVAGPINSAHS